MSKGFAIMMQKGRKKGAYNDVLDVAQALAPTYGSATNAIAFMVRQSALFRETLPTLAKTGKKREPVATA